MSTRIFLQIAFVILFIQTVKSQSYNLDVEELDQMGRPHQWNLGFNPEMVKSYPVTADSTIKHSGRYSIKLFSTGKSVSFGSCSVVIPSAYAGKQITLKGFLRTENVTKGYAGLWMRLDGETDTQGFDNMNNRGLPAQTIGKR